MILGSGYLLSEDGYRVKVDDIVQKALKNRDELTQKNYFCYDPLRKAFSWSPLQSLTEYMHTTHLVEVTTKDKEGDTSSHIFCGPQKILISSHGIRTTIPASSLRRGGSYSDVRIQMATPELPPKKKRKKGEKKAVKKPGEARSWAWKLHNLEVVKVSTKDFSFVKRKGKNEIKDKCYHVGRTSLVLFAVDGIFSQ